MNKKLRLYFSSFKASASNKPTALIMFILLIIVFTIALGYPMRMIFIAIEEDIFYSSVTVVEKDRYHPIDYNNYRGIAEKLKPINDKGMFAEDYHNHIEMRCSYPEMTKENGEAIEFERKFLCIEVKPRVLTAEEFVAKKQTMVVGVKFLEEHGLTEGDKINFEGSEFYLRLNSVDRPIDAPHEEMHIAYTANIKNFQYIPEGQTIEKGDNIKFDKGRIVLTGRQNRITSYEESILDEMGLVFEVYTSTGGLILPLLILILVAAGGIVCIIAIYNYILKINSRRYAIYKIIGMTPRTLLGVMMTENLALSGVGVGLGLGLEVLLCKMIPDTGLGSIRLIGLHCVFLVAVTLLTTLLTVGIKIIAQSSAVPASVKYLQ